MTLYQSLVSTRSQNSKAKYVAGLAGVVALVCFVYAMTGSASTSSTTTTTTTTVSPMESSFKDWMKSNDKSYINEAEYQNRLNIFTTNVNYIQIAQATVSHQMGITQFFDLTPAEFRLLHTGADPKMAKKIESEAYAKTSTSIPASVDWVSAGAVTGVKNQGQCGSCWSFSTTGSLEGGNVINNGQSLQSFSEQELVSCSQANGCNGGWPATSLYWVADNGDTLESDYPYVSGNGVVPVCNTAAEGNSVQNDSVNYTTPDNADSFTSAVAGQPLSIAVCASNLQYYTGGVLMDAACCKSIDHAVLAVGYGTAADGTLYWKIKNSWGPGWGEAGFFRMERQTGTVGNGGTCACLSYPSSYPTWN